MGIPRKRKKPKGVHDKYKEVGIINGDACVYRGSVGRHERGLLKGPVKTEEQPVMPLPVI